MYGVHFPLSLFSEVNEALTKTVAFGFWFIVGIAGVQ